MTSAESSARYYAKNIDRRRAAARDYYRRNRDEIKRKREIFMSDPIVRERYRVWAAERNGRKTTEDRRAYHLMRAFGLTLAQWDEMFVAQGRRCGICGTNSPGRSGRSKWHTDHCHKTRMVRGILCHSCNIFLGWYEKLHQQASAYLSGEFRK